MTLRFVRASAAAISLTAVSATVALDVETSRTTIISNYDEMRGIAWVMLLAAHCGRDVCPSTDSETPVNFYFGVEGRKRLPLRMVLRYTGSNWVFAHRMTFLVDGKRYVQEIPYTKWDRDTVSGGVWETVDVPISTLNPALQRALCGAKQVKVRFEGDHEAHDESLWSWQVEGLRQVCAAWRAPLKKYETVEQATTRLERERADRAAREAEERERVEEQARHEREQLEERARQEWQNTQARVRSVAATGDWEAAVTEALRHYIGCMGDPARLDCQRESSLYWEACEAKQGNATYCNDKYNRARGEQLDQQR